MRLSSGPPDPRSIGRENVCSPSQDGCCGVYATRPVPEVSPFLKQPVRHHADFSPRGSAFPPQRKNVCAPSFRRFCERACPECPWASSPPMEMKNLASVPWIRHPDRSRRFGGGAEGPAFSPCAHSLNHAGQMFFDRAESKGGSRVTQEDAPVPPGTEELSPAFQRLLRNSRFVLWGGMNATNASAGGAE
jgi:hypothetical protein